MLITPTLYRPRTFAFFDPDPGIDDAMAIIFAEAHPALELVGITTGVVKRKQAKYFPVHIHLPIMPAHSQYMATRRSRTQPITRST